MKNFIVAIPGGFVQIGDYHTPIFFSVKTAEEATRFSEFVATRVSEFVSLTVDSVQVIQIEV